jgi:hypothetical protein
MSIAKARTQTTKNPTRNVGLIANIRLGSIMRIPNQHPLAPSAHKVTEEQMVGPAHLGWLMNQSPSFRLT